MPYIPEKRRSDLEPQTLAEARTTGELNYQITCLIVDYLEANGLHYDTLSQARAACHDAAAELYRRVAGPYENIKRDTNGDVYPPHFFPTRHQGVTQ